MRTVSTLCASGTALSLSAVGLTFARPDHQDSRPHHHETPAPNSLAPSRPRVQDMTAVAYRQPATKSHAHEIRFEPRRTHSSPIVRRQTTPTPLRDVSANPKTGHVKHASTVDAWESRAITHAGVEKSEDTDRRPEQEAGSATPHTRPRSWLRRLSNSMSSSRDSSRAPTSQASSRPTSALISSTPGFIDSIPSDWASEDYAKESNAPPVRNKLVKRTASLSSHRRSASSGTSDSRLPLPVLKRPATSHQRSAALEQQRVEMKDFRARMSDISLDSTGSMRTYFTPRVPALHGTQGNSLSVSGIPNPIKRIYPDRKYIPTLVSVSYGVSRADVELDDGTYHVEGEHDETDEEVAHDIGASAASSPMPQTVAHLDHDPLPRRSFSIADLLSAGPQTLRKSQAGKRSITNKLTRRIRPRVSSVPSALMGNAFGHTASLDAERPAKRRDISDPSVYQRSIYTSSSCGTADTKPTHDSRALPNSSWTPQSLRNSYPDSPNVTSIPQPRCSTPTDQIHGTNGSHLPNVQPVRVSATHSEVPSTIGSDSEPPSISDYSTDYQSDTLYDSLPTRATRGSLGKRGPPIETIFDESPPTFSSGRSTRLRDFLSDGHNFGSEHSGMFRHSTIEEESSVFSTPVRSTRERSVASTPSAPHNMHVAIPSSPPTMRLLPDSDDMDWTIAQDFEGVDGQALDMQHRSPLSTPNNSGTGRHLRPGPFAHLTNVPSLQSTPNRGELGAVDRASLFDWSEQQPSPIRGDHSPPRPKTVHGKKEPDCRGSRTTGRRAPSGMHARSHSVPVVPDVDGKRSSTVANKFGTWGVGSKGVTEDWNEDFDFEDAVLPSPSALAQMEEKRIDSGHEMFVPRSIREQQENVVANISLLREWGLLIEELKDLRIRAVALGMLHGQYAAAWKEVDAMIELADQESEEHTLEPRHSPPSSPGFDYSAFEEPPQRLSFNTRRRPSAQLADSALDRDPLWLGSPTDPFALPSSPASPKRRPRKDSELVARMVIEALQSQSKQNRSDATPNAQGGVNKKVPFDTATLRHIVPYVNSLKRRVKDALRETEGLYSSPQRNSNPPSRDLEDDAADAPAFQQIFTSPTARATVKHYARADDRAEKDVFYDAEQSELAASMKALELPP